MKYNKLNGVENQILDYGSGCIALHQVEIKCYTRKILVDQYVIYQDVYTCHIICNHLSVLPSDT